MSEGESPAPGGTASPSPKSAPRWLRVVPFFMSAVFFLSALFALIAPLPLLFLRFRTNRKLAFAAMATNSAIVLAAGGWESFAVYAIFVLALVIPMTEFFSRGVSLEKSAGLTLAIMGLSLLAVFASIGWIFHINPWVEFRGQIDIALKQLSAPDSEELRERVMVEFPSVIAWMMLCQVWMNSVIVLRFNPGGIRERIGLNATFLKQWKTPEWLVWPTIVSGFLLLVDLGPLSDVGVNIFKFLMAIYAIQGLSVLAHVFDVWGVKGALRPIGYLVSILLMMPLLLSLGFFDLWFDFRSKFRQS